MIDNIAFGQAGCARGEIEIERLVFFDIDLRLTDGGARQQCLVVSAKGIAIAEAYVMNDLR
ncbi:hypothetical protein D3C81_2087570 [compost metagenome]